MHGYKIREDSFDLNIMNFVSIYDNKVSNRKVWTGVLGLLIIQLIFTLLNFFHKLCKYVKCSCDRVCCGKSLIYQISNVICCCMLNKKKEFIDDVSGLFNEFFDQDSMVPTDGIAALTYLHAQTKAKRDRKMSLGDTTSKIHYYYLQNMAI